MTQWLNPIITHGAGKDFQMLFLEVRSFLYTSCCSIQSIISSRCIKSYPSVSNALDIVWLTIDIVPPPTKVFVFQTKVRLNPCCIAIHHETDSSCRGENGNLRVANTALFGEPYYVTPYSTAAARSAGGTASLTGI